MGNAIETEIETEAIITTKLFKKRGIYNVENIDPSNSLHSRWNAPAFCRCR